MNNKQLQAFKFIYIEKHNKRYRTNFYTDKLEIAYNIVLNKYPVFEQIAKEKDFNREVKIIERAIRSNSKTDTLYYTEQVSKRFYERIKLLKGHLKNLGITKEDLREEKEDKNLPQNLDKLYNFFFKGKKF